MSVFDNDPQRTSGERAVVVSISNELFQDPDAAQTGEQITKMLAKHADDRFKAEGSLILCAPPDVSPRAIWADKLP